MTRMPEYPGGNQLPIAKKDIAETFSESDVTVDVNGTIIGSGQIELGPSDLSLGDDTDYEPTSQKRGVIINPNQELTGLVAYPGNFGGGVSGTAYLIKHSDGSVLETVSHSDDTSGSISFSSTLSVDTDYRLVWDFDGSSENMGYNNSPDFPYEGGAFDVPASVEGSATSTNWRWMWERIEAGDVKVGTATVEWPEPDDVFRWDSATWQATKDGETVKIDVQESTDGGSTWTTIATDIQRGQDISNADPSGRVRLVANLERADTSNNPTVDAVARRWVL